MPLRNPINQNVGMHRVQGSHLQTQNVMRVQPMLLQHACLLRTLPNTDYPALIALVHKAYGILSKPDMPKPWAVHDSPTDG
jgi:hypothetical protein